MNIAWHSAKESDLIQYFDVNPAYGLNDVDVLKRLKRFGNNADPVLLPVVQRCMYSYVRRQGKQQRVKSSHVVPGDVVVLRAGDRVPADIRLLYVDGLTCNQTSINGQSSVIKNTLQAKNHDKNTAFCGSFVVSGTGFGVVIARGATTVLASIIRTPKTKHIIKNSLLARRLRRFGIVIQNQKVLTKYKDINLLFIEVSGTDSDIIDVIRKVQLTQRIPCKFIINQHQAERLAKELNAVVWDVNKELDSSLPHIKLALESAQFIIGNNEPALVKIATMLSSYNTTLLWITDGKTAHTALQLAAVSLVIGDDARGDVLVGADLIAPKAAMGIATRILYNRHQ